MKVIYTGFVFLVVCLLFFVNGTFPEDPALADARLFLLGIGLISVASLWAFMNDVWKKGASKAQQPQEVKAKTFKTPAQVVSEANKMKMIIIVVLLLGGLLLLEYLGYHDMLMQGLEWGASKGERVINALTH